MYIEISLSNSSMDHLNFVLNLKKPKVKYESFFTSSLEINFQQFIYNYSNHYQLIIEKKFLDISFCDVVPLSYLYEHLLKTRLYFA